MSTVQLYAGTDERTGNLGLFIEGNARCVAAEEDDSEY